MRGIGCEKNSRTSVSSPSGVENKPTLIAWNAEFRCKNSWLTNNSSASVIGFARRSGFTCSTRDNSGRSYNSCQIPRCCSVIASRFSRRRAFASARNEMAVKARPPMMPAASKSEYQFSKNHFPNVITRIIPQPAPTVKAGQECRIWPKPASVGESAQCVRQARIRLSAAVAVRPPP